MYIQPVQRGRQQEVVKLLDPIVGYVEVAQVLEVGKQADNVVYFVAVQPQGLQLGVVGKGSAFNTIDPK